VTRHRVRRLWTVLGVLGTLSLAGPPSAWAASEPTVSLSRASVRSGESVVVRLDGWHSHAVTVSVCGNLARRGSVDCDLFASQGVPIAPNVPESLTDFVVTAPPTTCPCVVRASDATQSEIAFTPIDVVGVPTGPVVGPPESSPLRVSVRARRAHAGLGGRIRSSLGGQTAYDVTVVIRNPSAEPLTGVRLYGWAGRSGTDQSRTLDFPAVDDLGPGQTWSHTVRVHAPSPHIGRFYWEVSVTGVGPPVHAEAVTRDVPFLLVVLILVIVGDLAAMIGRRLRHRRSHDGEADRHVAVPTGLALGHDGGMHVRDPQPVAGGG
jgi:hypothetical protein